MAWLSDERWKERFHDYGATVSGALFGAAWWIWVDAVAVARAKGFGVVPADHYIPGFIATLALMMINGVRREDLTSSDPYDDGVGCRARAWLLISYIVSFASLTGAVWVLIQHYANNDAVTSAEQMWPGVAGVVQSVLIVASGLVLWLSRPPAPESFF